MIKLLELQDIGLHIIDLVEMLRGCVVVQGCSLDNAIVACVLNNNRINLELSEGLLLCI